MGNSHGNFQIHRFTTSENITKSFRGGGYFFDSHCIAITKYTLKLASAKNDDGEYNSRLTIERTITTKTYF